MSGENFDIFISYRRSDGEDIASKITETLKGKNYRCFLDYYSLKGGKFDDKIEQAIKDAPIFIAVMTPDYLVRPPEKKEEETQNHEKETEKEDWVYKEIECAINNKKRIIPINYNNRINDFPTEVPDNISEGLGAHTFAIVSSGQQYPRDMEALINDWISETVPQPTQKTEGKANIEVYSDCNCNILKANEVIATVSKGGYNIIKLRQGRHRLICQSSQFSDIKQEQILTVNESLADDFFDITLAEQIEIRINADKPIPTPEPAKFKEYKLLKTLEGHSDWVRSVAYSPDGTKIISGSSKKIDGKYWWGDDKCVGEIKIWDANTGECLKTLEGDSDKVLSVAYSPDGTRIVSGLVVYNTDEYTGIIKIWDANTGQCLKTLEGDECSVNSVAYSPDGKRIISGSDDWTIKIWDANTGECLKTLEGDEYSVNSVAYSPDGKKIISGSSDNTVKIWDANTGECLKTLEGHLFQVWSVAFSPDGTKIISGSDDSTIKIWNANTGECLKTLEIDFNGVDSVAFSPDGTKIVSTSEDRTIKIWDANTGQCLKTLEGHSSCVNSVAYSPDGTRIVSGSMDKTIKIWGV